MKIQADNLSGNEAVRHGFFSSRGGVSTGIYKTLNCGQGSNDNADHVAQNRRRVADELGVDVSHLISPHQIHSATALVVEEPWQAGSPKPQLDALVTRTPGLAISVLTADCAPVLFCDPQAGVIGAAHAGWRGALGGVLDHTIDQMCMLGAKKDDICATVGPAISLDIYEVGEEFRNNFLVEDPGNDRFFAKPVNAVKVHFDLQAYVQHRLAMAGLQHIGAVEHCTFGREEQYFSYRRSQKKGYPDYGRQISAIVIR
jgi:YfiH family protein